MKELDQGERLLSDPRLGKWVKLLDESQRRGYDVFGRLREIIRHNDGSEVWNVTCGQLYMVKAASSLFELLNNQDGGPFAIQDDAPFPLTLEALEARLRQGQAFHIESRGSDGFSYALWFQEGRFFLRQGSNLHPFHQVEPALFTLLNCLGMFSPPSGNLNGPEHRE